jgi:hypothetical protein
MAAMRLLFTLPHYASSRQEKASDGRGHGSLTADHMARVEAMTACLTSLRQLFSPAPCVLDHAQKIALPGTPTLPYHLDVVVCTTGDCHLLDQLPAGTFQQRATKVAPELLGFACHDVLRERLGAYDYYCYLEDDLVLHDPWWFIKLRWFTKTAGDMCVLQPNRYEAGLGGLATKLYVDGDLAPHCTNMFQDLSGAKPITAEVMGVPVTLERTRNPHAGCFFLNARQMGYWAQRPDFNDRQSRFIGPLETAASLGIMRTFQVFKPAERNADFLEVQHFGTNYLKQLCPPNKSATAPAR